MALDGTLAGLNETLTGFLNRRNLAARIPDFIAMCEAKLNREPLLEVLQESDVSLATTAGSRFVPSPAGLVEATTLWLEWPWGREELTKVLASAMDTSTVATRPWFWAIDGARIAFERPADQAYALTLRARSRFSLAASTPSALQLLADHPDVYVYGPLMEAAPYLRDDERLATWGTLWTQAKESVAAQCMRLRGGAPLRVDPALRGRPPRFNVWSGC